MVGKGSRCICRQYRRAWESSFSLPGFCPPLSTLECEWNRSGTWQPHEDTVLVRREERVQEWSADKVAKALKTAPRWAEAGRQEVKGMVRPAPWPWEQRQLGQTDISEAERVGHGQ